MAFEVGDLAGLGKAAEKLIHEVSKGVGALANPLLIKQNAKAEAERIKLIGNAETEVEAGRKIALAKANHEVSLIEAEFESEIAKRAQKRLVFQEVRRQENLESVVNNSIRYLPPSVSESPLNDDWRQRFFNVAQDISDNEMQEFWGKLLAGEVANPGTFSLRTVEILRNLSGNEARLFEKAANLVINNQHIFKLNNEEDLNKYLSFNEILILRSSGLIYDSDVLAALITIDPILKKDNKNMAIYPCMGEIFVLTNLHPEKTILDAYTLTPQGRELLTLVERKPNYDYLRSLANFLKQKGYFLKKFNITTPVLPGNIESALEDI